MYWITVLKTITGKMSASYRRKSCSELPFRDYEERDRGCLWGLLGKKNKSTYDIELYSLHPER